MTRRDIVVTLSAACVALGAAALAAEQPPVMQSSALDWAEMVAKPTNVGSVRQLLRAPTATLDELELHVTTLNPGQTSHAPHVHPNEELVIVKEGTVEALVRGEWKRLGPGSVIFNGANELHGLRSVGDVPAVYHVINWKVASPAAPTAAFDWFEYTGRDEIFAAPLPPGSYRNPILAGFYPDPSICRVGEDYYLVTSSFAFFPGVPIFHSRDLVHWTQIGHVLDRPSQIKLDGLGVSRGIFAPAIRYHAGVFYMVTTLVDGGGNFFVTATNPAGPWSDPVWLKEIDGIDPSFFFDDNGKAYLVNNGPPPDAKPLYSGHRAIWLQEFDVKTQRPTGPRTIIVNGGVDMSKKPIWIEGPHLLKKDGWYYLIAAEGGTAEDHSEVVFRSRAVDGPYQPCRRNPMLTQRTLGPDRPLPVTSTGHADFVETPDGKWWSVFLGCRPYAGKLYNTGRETFMLPVSWNAEGPTVLANGLSVPLVVPAPKLAAAAEPKTPRTGNFTWRDEFDAARLDPSWNVLRTAGAACYDLGARPGSLTLRAWDVSLRDKSQPAFVGRRQQHAHFAATAAVHLPEAGASAGLTAFQNESHHLFLAARVRDGKIEVYLERVAGGPPEVLASADVAVSGGKPLLLRIEGAGGDYSFAYATEPDAWSTLKDKVDGSILSTAVAGGFVGTYLGPHARLDR